MITKAVIIIVVVVVVAAAAMAVASMMIKEMVSVCLNVFWCNTPQWARASSFTRFVDQT